MKHILFISPDNPFLKRTGGQIFDFATIMHLSKLFVVHVATMADEPILEQYDNVVIHYLSRRFQRVATLRGKIEFFFQLFLVLLPRASSLIATSENKVLLEKVIVENMINLVVYNHLESIALIDLSAKNKVLIHHNNEGRLAKTLAQKEKSVAKKLFYFIESYKIRFLERRLKSFTLEHFALSCDEAQEVSMMTNRSCDLFPVRLGIEIKKYNSKSEEDFLYIFGNWDYLPTREGLEYIINFIEKEKSDIKLKVSGYCSSSEFMKRLHNCPQIEYLGFIDEQMVKHLLNTAKVTIIPIFSGAGVKIKLIEALECNACILTTLKAIEGLPNVPLLTQSVELFEDMNELAKKITFLVNNDEKRTMLRKNTSKYITYYHNLSNNMLEKLMKLA